VPGIGNFDFNCRNTHSRPLRSSNGALV
jgi:hypothetical protein